MHPSRLLAVLPFLVPAGASAQVRQTQVNVFGHHEFTVREEANEKDAYFTLGEHSLFVTSALNNRLSFLGEFVVRFNSGSATNYLPSIERSLVRYSYSNKHSVIAGKVHTPVNYWNDVYHHGRVFFPVVDRPFAFSHLVPLHTLGVQLQGQNLGAARFGYDVMVGNGIASTDASADGTSQAFVAAFHVKPADGVRIGASYYYDHLAGNAYGAHSGHSTSPQVAPAERYRGPLTYQLGSVSLAWFGTRAELLNEFTYNLSSTDTLGTATNHSNFVYAGYRVADGIVPYVLADRMTIAENDRHVYPMRMEKVAAGVRFEPSALVNLKIQLEHQSQALPPHSGTLMHPTWHEHRSWGVRMQLAYGF